MKQIAFFCLFSTFLACSALIPYKDQNLDYLYHIQKSPEAYKGAVVAFEGNVLGVRETPGQIRLVLKIEAPLYYYATGKGGSLAYELLLVEFAKEPEQKPSSLQKGSKIKVLARVSGYETRSTGFGQKVGAVRLEAIALANPSAKKDIFLKNAQDLALYHSWKEGKLFFDETARQVIEKIETPPAR